MLGIRKKREKPVISLNIASKRKALGLSAEALAEVAGIPYPTLRNIEAGVSAGRPETRERIAKALGCTLADLYTDPANPAKMSVPAQDSLGPLLEQLIEQKVRAMTQPQAPREIIEGWPKLPPDLQAVLLYFVTGKREHLSKAADEVIRMIEKGVPNARKAAAKA